MVSVLDERPLVGGAVAQAISSARNVSNPLSRKLVFRELTKPGVNIGLRPGGLEWMCIKYSCAC